MKPTINDLVLLILDTVQQVNARNVWHGFFEISGHTASVSVYFHPAGHAYQAPTAQQARPETRYAYADAKFYGSEEEALRELHNLLAFARRHLTAQQEAA